MHPQVKHRQRTKSVIAGNSKTDDKDQSAQGHPAAGGEGAHKAAAKGADPPLSTPRHPLTSPTLGLPGLTELLGQAGPVLVPASPEPALSLPQREATLHGQEVHLGLESG